MKWNVELDRKLAYLVDLGKTNEEIGTELNCSESAARNRCRRLKLTRVRHEDVKCKKCGLVFNKAKHLIQIFCSRSCSASFNNSGRERSLITKEKIKSSLIKKNLNSIKKIKEKIIRGCRNCGGSVEKKKIICSSCKENYYKFYRPLCEFKFALSDYPDEFEFNLIKKHGWYSPSNKKNNLGGISRDHLYCVKDGFLNKVDPEIIKHPANCKLMIHSDNNSKHNTSCITLEELLEKIKNWSYG